MIKGVNKRIIEVKETDSRMFDSVLLFVNPAYSNADGYRLKKEADRIIQNFAGAMTVSLCENPSKKPKTKKRYPIAFALGIVLGFVTAFLIFK